MTGSKVPTALLAGYYEPWVLTERERMAAAYVAALRQLGAARAQQGDFKGAIEAARRAVQADPLEQAIRYALEPEAQVLRTFRSPQVGVFQTLPKLREDFAQIFR
jgi:two-component SAPR family response regulator